MRDISDSFDTQPFRSLPDLKVSHMLVMVVLCGFLHLYGVETDRVAWTTLSIAALIASIFGLVVRQTWTYFRWKKFYTQEQNSITLNALVRSRNFLDWLNTAPANRGCRKGDDFVDWTIDSLSTPMLAMLAASYRMSVKSES